MSTSPDNPGPRPRTSERARVARDLRDSTSSLVEKLQFKLSQLRRARAGSEASIVAQCDETLAEIVRQLDLAMTGTTLADGPFVNALFDEEPPGTFAEGYLFRGAPDLESARQDAGNGYWHCDLTDQNSLTWSEKVYELFGLPPGAPIRREWAVARYGDQSRSALESVRTFALKREFGFILDAEIRPKGSASRWIRVLAVPVLEAGRVVGLHGVKRAL